MGIRSPLDTAHRKWGTDHNTCKGRITVKARANRRSIALWAVLGIAVIGLVGPRIYHDVAYSDGNLHHAAHWFVYGYDQVWYRDRAYVYGSQMARHQADSEFGPLEPTGQTVIGLPVLETPLAAHSPYVPTILVLQKNPQTDIVYGLSGGP